MSNEMLPAEKSRYNSIFEKVLELHAFIIQDGIHSRDEMELLTKLRELLPIVKNGIIEYDKIVARILLQQRLETGKPMLIDGWVDKQREVARKYLGGL